VEVSNFPVEAGDTICVLLCAPQPDLGHVTLLNLSKRNQTSVAVKARDAIRSVGATAEWIVEMNSPDLPAFDPITFNECACATDSHLRDLNPGSTTEIYNSEDVNLTQSTIASETSVIVRWQGWK
jgi:Peptidase A4 family